VITLLTRGGAYLTLELITAVKKVWRNPACGVAVTHLEGLDSSGAAIVCFRADQILAYGLTELDRAEVRGAADRIAQESYAARCAPSPRHLRIGDEHCSCKQP
jgi:hypothetical protein